MTDRNPTYAPDGATITPFNEVLKIGDKLVEHLPDDLKADYIKNLEYVLRAGKRGVVAKHDPLALIPPLLAGLAKGMSVSAVLKKIPIPRTTFYELTLKYPQLKLALTMGQEMAKGFWEEVQRISLTGNNNVDFYPWFSRMQRQFGILSGYGNPADPNIIIPGLAQAETNQERIKIVLDLVANSGLGTKAFANLLDGLKHLGEMDEYKNLGDQVQQLAINQEMIEAG